MQAQHRSPARAREMARGWATPLLERLRASGRPVAWTPPWMGFGNHVFIWFWAWRGISRAEDRRLLQTEAMQPWLDLFPGARRFVLPRQSVKWRDARLIPWKVAPDRDVSKFAIDWTPKELRGFVEEVILSSAEFTALLDRAGADVGDGETLVINVRRGDYYHPEHIEEWGFDVEAFIRDAVALKRDQSAITRLHFVSDDLDWCAEHLDDLGSDISLTYEDRSHSPQRQFATICAARHLVVSNSTFSYWGGYVGDVVQGSQRTVIAPRFFNRTQNDGDSWMLDPSWTVLDTTDTPSV